MVEYEPIPIFEAMQLLLNRSNSIDGFFDAMALRYPANLEEYKEYRAMLKPLKKALLKSVSVDEATLNVLFSPLVEEKHGNNQPDSVPPIASIIIGNISNYINLDEANFFDVLRANPEWIFESILRCVYDCITDDALAAESRKDPENESELLRLILKSELPVSAKMRLIELTLSPIEYIDMLEKTVMPVASVFSSMRDRWEPLVELYRRSYANITDAKEIVCDRYKYVPENAEKFTIYPSVMMYNSFNFSTDFPIPNAAGGFVGVLFDVFWSSAGLTSFNDSEISRILSIVGDRVRFEIIEHLVKGPSYGRELTKLLNLTPGAVSRHLSILAGTGLVVANADGKKIYYSLDREHMKEFLSMLNHIFLPDMK